MMIRHVESKHMYILVDLIYTEKPGYNDIGLYDNLSIVSFSVVPVNSSLFAINNILLCYNSTCV
jgi:hypothetical protein